MDAQHPPLLTASSVTPASDRSRAAAPLCSLKQASLVILQRTATYLASTPGGLRFVGSSREGLKALQALAGGTLSSTNLTSPQNP